jgi:nicotinate-nucleotide adenylyltransferase
MSQPPSGSRRVAFFGGSFDPPHLGHLAVARAAREALDLETVLFAPVGTQPLKPVGSTASFDDRVAMTELAISGETGFAISLADAPRDSGDPNYTLETLIDVRKELPPDWTLFCLMGADAFVGLRNWHRAIEIPFVAPLIVASRPGESLSDLTALLPPGLTLGHLEHPDRAEGNTGKSGIEARCYSLFGEAGSVAGLCTPLYLLPGLYVEISASQIRAMARTQSGLADGCGAASQELLPDAVFDYMRTHNLYR